MRNLKIKLMIQRTRNKSSPKIIRMRIKFKVLKNSKKFQILKRAYLANKLIWWEMIHKPTSV
jgi:hypothetical protein